MKKLFVLLSFFIIVSCSPHNKKSEQFVKRIEAAFKSGATEVVLSEVTDFEWDEVCLFYPSGSEKFSGYWAYDEYFLSKNLNAELKLTKKPYKLIVIFRNNKDHIHYTPSKRHLKINQDSFWLVIDSPSSKYTRMGGCLKKNVKITKTTEPFQHLVFQ